MKTAVLPGWMLRKLRHDPELGERFVLLVMDRTTASLPFEMWPGATEELSASKASASAAELGISAGAFIDALERARKTYELTPGAGVLRTEGATSGLATPSRPAVA